MKNLSFELYYGKLYKIRPYCDFHCLNDSNKLLAEDTHYGIFTGYYFANYENEPIFLIGKNHYIIYRKEIICEVI